MNYIQPPSKPIEETQFLFELFEPYTEERKVKAKIKIKFGSSSLIDHRKLIILVEGKAGLYRDSDNLLITHLSPVSIFGIAELFAPNSLNYFKAETDCTIKTIMAEDVIRLLDENNAWPAVTRLLSHYVKHLAYRDLMMVGNTTYGLIRNCIYEYHQLPDELKNTQSLSTYIESKTALSRSRVMKILLGLKTGGYIEMKRGRLTHLEKLPHEY
ncbi:helix-turn-helix domain-containing protein [Buttiauxella noackiae]|uniref:helix-turn-helix domain-containing protein n=1 Tax=Buttiauxella noackiae TaxID=82992 RepID=UPI0035A64451